MTITHTQTGAQTRTRFPVLRTGYSKAKVTQQNLRARASSAL